LCPTGCFRFIVLGRSACSDERWFKDKFTGTQRGRLDQDALVAAWLTLPE